MCENMDKIIEISENDAMIWDSYILDHPEASVYHLYMFRKVIEQEYHHKSIYLLLKVNDEIRGVLPLYQIRSPFTGNGIVSLPFCDYGGVLADTPEYENLLITEAVKLCKRLGLRFVELRQTKEISCELTDIRPGIICSKVRMAAQLKSTPDEQFNYFPAKLRSQIRKPSKEGCTIKNGRTELLDDFYKVFTRNMRDLGSPVHSKKFLSRFVEESGEKAQVFVVYKDTIPIGGAIVAGIRDVLVNPWASFDKRYRPLAPNMLLYWGMLEWAINNGFKVFDFGRSTVDEGTYKFKQQWGAQPQQLFWYYFSLDGADRSVDTDGTAKKLFLKCWQKLPVPASVMIGPAFRRLIPL
jgi:FemAB-related protein (PEP-CTERM system-associated)